MIRRTTVVALSLLTATACTHPSSAAGRGATPTPVATTVAPAAAAPSTSADSTSADSTSPATSTAARTSAPTRPAISKVLVIIEENHSRSQMKTGMPYLYGLAQRYAYASDYRAITHPSLPNYLAIAGGSTFGVQDDENPAAHVIHGASVFSQALAAGRTAKLYAESMPSSCDLTSAGSYAVRHAPWAYFTDQRAACRRGLVPAGGPTKGAFVTDVRRGTLPTAGMLIPDLGDDAHDGTLGEADAWLKAWLPGVLAGPDFTAGRLVVVVTADEDNYTSVNKVLTVVLARGVSHKVVTTPLTHYSLTRLYDDVMGVKRLRNAATAPSLSAALGLLLSR